MNIPERHLDILKLIKQGYTSQEIASKLFISKKTVEKIRYEYTLRFNCKNATHLIVTMMERRLL